MCRLLAYVGPDILISHVVLWPSRSIIKQSYDARERQNDSSLPLHLSYGNLNGDGFGIGWYPLEGAACGHHGHRDPTPCTFTSVTPAWNNDNLNRLATKIESGIVFGHVRAAYPGMPVSEQNCHPFAHSFYLFMHNGVVAGFMDIRRKLLEQLSNEAYNAVQSFHSDSAVSFALFLNNLPNLHERQPPEVLLSALQATITTITRVQKEAGITSTSLLNFVLSDGKTLIATRYVSNDKDQPASMYYAEGEGYERMKPLDATVQRAEAAAAAVRGASQGPAGVRSGSVTEEGDYHLTYNSTGNRVFLVASEPVTTAASDWAEVPRNTALVVCREKGTVLSVVHAPLCADGVDPRQPDVMRSLEAVSLVGTNFPVVRSASTFTVEQHEDFGHNGALIKHRQAKSEDEPIAGDEDAQQHRLTGHSGAVVSFCIDGEYLFSGSTDCTIKVWNLADCTCVKTLVGHRDPIRQLFIRDGILYSVGAKTIRLWPIPDFECKDVMLVGGLSGSLKSMVAGVNKEVYVGGQDCKIKAYDVLKPCERGLTPMVDSPKCMTASETIRTALGDAQKPRLTSAAKDDHCSSVNSLALLGDEYICSGSGDSTIRVWRQKTLELVKVLRGHRGSVLTLHAVPGLLLSGGRDAVIRVWDTETLVCRRTLNGHTDDVLSISSFGQDDTFSFHTNGHHTNGVNAKNNDGLAEDEDGPGSPTAGSKTQIFTSASADGTIRLWSASCYTCLYVFSSAAGPNRMPLACVVNERWVIGGLPDGSIALHPLEDVWSKNTALISPRSNNSNEAVPPAVKRMRTASPSKSCEGLSDLPARSINTEFEKTLRTFIRIKTVSADPSLSEECFRGAKFLLRLLENMGAEVKLSQPVENCNPIVLGRVGSDPSRPTLTFYGHYDVQPAMEPEWQTDPFEITAVDGYLYARGVSDNKGPCLAEVFAIRELLEENKGGGGLPVNVVFLFEGEEENGSRGFREAVQQNLRWFEGTRAVLISNTLWVGEEKPCITYGMRGMISLSIEVKGLAKDLHSGNDGGVVSEPLSDLCRVLGTLCDSHNVQIPGFYDKVRQDTLQAAIARLDGSNEFSLDDYKRSLGVEKLTTGGSERDTLEARWCLPTLSVVDVRVGTAEDADTAHYRFGPTRFSVIPRGAVGKVSIRYVPDQNADKLVECLTNHVQHEFAKLRSGNSVTVKVHSVGDWWEANPNSQLMKITENAVREVWGVPPLLVREGGTMPVASALEKMLNAPAILLPMGQSSDSCHLANERIRRINLLKGKSVIKSIVKGMGEMS